MTVFIPDYMFSEMEMKIKVNKEREMPEWIVVQDKVLYFLPKEGDADEYDVELNFATPDDYLGSSYEVTVNGKLNVNSVIDEEALAASQFY